MAELADIQNELIRSEIEEFIESEEEKRHIIQMYARTKPNMQDIAACVIEGSHKLEAPFPYSHLPEDWEYPPHDRHILATMRGHERGRTAARWEDIPGFRELPVRVGDAVYAVRAAVLDDEAEKARVVDAYRTKYAGDLDAIFGRPATLEDFARVYRLTPRD